jgi:hypothetical protein
MRGHDMATSHARARSSNCDGMPLRMTRFEEVQCISMLRVPAIPCLCIVKTTSSRAKSGCRAISASKKWRREGPCPPRVHLDLVCSREAAVRLCLLPGLDPHQTFRPALTPKLYVFSHAFVRSYA